MNGVDKKVVKESSKVDIEVNVRGMNIFVQEYEKYFVLLATNQV